ncbi:hypothetical protein [Streptomyces sp. 2A115]|uniref:hypothetical protein n=1 Tax=Streptomyces sp. 2A115 TaxID=3457439 RepID=UPI003FD11955
MSFDDQERMGFSAPLDRLGAVPAVLRFRPGTSANQGGAQGHCSPPYDRRDAAVMLWLPEDPTL